MRCCARRTRCRRRMTWPPRSSPTSRSRPTPSRAKTATVLHAHPSGLDHHPQITMDDGADLVSSCTQPARPARRPRRRDRRNHHRRHSPSRHGHRGRAGFPGRGGQRRDDQASVRQPLRYRPERPRRRIRRATNVLIAGKTVVVGGYGWCSTGSPCAPRALAPTSSSRDRPGQGAGSGDGRLPRDADRGRPSGDIFITATGNISVIDGEDFAA